MKQIESTIQRIARDGVDKRLFYSGLLGNDETFVWDSEEQRIQSEFIELDDIKGQDVVQVAGGGYHSLILLSNGQVFSTGWNRHGQLSLQHFNDVKGEEMVQFNDNVCIKQVSASGRNSFFVTDTGLLYVCGSGAEGRLGITYLLNQDVCIPTLMESLRGYRVISIGCGFWHTFVGTDDGRVFAWGDGRMCKLGIEDQFLVPQPEEIVSLRGQYLKKATGGAWHSVLLMESGRIYTMGSNYWYQCGRTTSEEECEIEELKFFKDMGVIDVSAGSNFTFVLTKDGSVYSFGCGAHGKTGQGTTESQISLPMKLDFKDKIVKLECGSNHTLFLSDKREVFSCGWSRYTQLGHYSTEDIPRPKKIDSLCGIDIKLIAAGGFYSLFVSDSSCVPKIPISSSKLSFSDVDIITTL